MFKWFNRIISLVLIVFVIYSAIYISGAVKVYKKAYLIQYDSEIEYFDSKSIADKMLLLNMLNYSSQISPCRAFNVAKINEDYTEEELSKYLPVIFYAYRVAQDDFKQMFFGTAGSGYSY